MHPYNFDKELMERTYQINLNYQLFYQNYSQFNPYLYPYNQSMFALNFQNLNLSNNTPFYSFNTYLISQPSITKVDRSKKHKIIVKKLVDINIQSKFPQIYIEMNHKQKQSNNFKYFDPFRAPTITSLRTDSQLELDLKQIQQKTEQSVDQFEGIQNDNSMQKDVNKLQLLLKQPNENKYPFLICKKRKNYRMMKRRYSVFYFEQRANFIKNGIPIPQNFHPKNRSKKYQSQNKIDYLQPLHEISEQINDDQSVKSNSVIIFSQEQIKSSQNGKNKQIQLVKRQSLFQENKFSNNAKVKYQQ